MQVSKICEHMRICILKEQAQKRWWLLPFGLTFEDVGGQSGSLLKPRELIWAHFWSIWGSFGINFEAWGGHWDLISETLGSEGVKGYLSPLLFGFFESQFGDLSVPFFWNRPPCGVFCIAFGSIEKVSQNDSQKCLPGGPQEGSRLDGSSMLTFAAEPKKDSKMGAKMERFESPKSPLYYFLEDLLRADV